MDTIAAEEFLENVASEVVVSSEQGIMQKFSDFEMKSFTHISC